MSKEKRRKIIVYYLNENRCRKFSSVDNVVEEHPSLTAKRIEYCIKSGQSWHTMAFDEVWE